MEWEWSEGLASLSGGPRVYRGLEEIGEATLAANTDQVLEQPMAAVWTLRDGKAIRARYYDDPSHASEAVGLREWGFRPSSARHGLDEAGDGAGHGADQVEATSRQQLAPLACGALLAPEHHEHDQIHEPPVARLVALGQHLLEHA